MAFLKNNFFSIFGFYLISFGISAILCGCVGKAVTPETAEVRFSNPNEKAILANSDNIRVSVVYQNGESLVLFAGNRQNPGFSGPWIETIRKEDLTLLIVQFDVDGNELAREEYFYTFRNNRLIISEKLEITPIKLNLSAGGPPFHLGIKLFPSTLELPISWGTSDPAIVSITDQGVILPLSAGTVKIFAKAGENLSDTITVMVTAEVVDKDTLHIISGLEDVIVNIDEDASFSILAEGENISYRWKLNGEEQLGITKASYLLNNVDLDLNNVEVTVEVFNKDTIATSSAILKVLDPTEPLALLDTLPDLNLNEGDEVSIRVLVNKNTNVSYAWMKEESLLSNSPIYAIPSASSLDSGTYIVNVSWEEEVVSDTFRIALLPPEKSVITAEAGENGTIIHNDTLASSVIVSKGQNADFYIIPNTGYVIDSVWVDAVANMEAVNAGAYNFIDVTGDHSLKATFKKQQFNLSLNINDALKGMVTVEPDQTVFNYGETVILTATPTAADIQFTGWTGDSSATENPLTLVMDKNYSLMANFSEIGEYKLNLFIFPEAASGSVNLNPEQVSYLSGSEIALEAIPEEGWVFANWYGNDTQITGTESSLNITMGFQDIDCTAKFERIPIAVRFSTNPATGNPGNPQTKAGDIYWGDTINIQANAADGYNFEYWELAATSVGSIRYVNGTADPDETASILVTGGEINLIANYRLIE